MENDKCCEDANGDCKISPENKLSITVQECIKNEVKKQGFKSYHVQVNDISTNGGNYLGVLQTVDVQNYTGDKEINLFVKNTIKSKEEFFFSMNEVYWRESFVYKELLKKYAQLQEEYNVPEDERYRTVNSYCELSTDTIILENVAKLGFKTGDRKDVFSLKFAEMAVTQLAKFHGLSFALQRKQPKYFEKHVKSMKHLYNFDYNWQDYVKKVIDAAIEGLEGEAKVKLINFFPVFVEKFQQYFRQPEEESVCLCHGDFRANNVLVKTIDGEEKEILVIDYQFVNYSSPVLDLLYFIFVGTDQEFRDTHLDHLKQLYYDSLETFLKYFDINAEEVYSRKRFEKDFQGKLDFGLIMFLTIMPLLFTEDDVVPDISDDIDAMNFVLDDSYKVRTREIVDYFIQQGCL